MKDVEIQEKLVNRCPKCNGIMGKNIEGKPICACQQLKMVYVRRKTKSF